MNSIKVLISIIIALTIAVIIIFSIILNNDIKKEKEQVNKNPSSIQQRKDALKEVFK